MAQLYSYLIYEGHDLGGNYTVGLDPAYVWIVRDIDVFFPGPGGLASVQVTAAVVGTTFAAFTALNIPPSGQWQGWRGRQVFVPPLTGPTLSIEASSPLGGPDVRISGYRLLPP